MVERIRLSDPADPSPEARDRALISALEKTRPQPLRKLPTDRIKFQTQLDIIRGYGAISQNGTRAVNYREVAKLVKLDPTTVSLLNPFLVDNGFVERSSNDLIPSKPVVDFSIAHSWSAEMAPRKLLPIVQRSWFGNSLRSRLSFHPMSKEKAIAELANEIAATNTDLEPRLALLLDYAEAAGLVRREGNQIVVATNMAEPIEASAELSGTSHLRSDAQVLSQDGGSRSSGSVGTGFMSTEGAVQFHVSIRVTMQEMAGWSPDRIAAFFSGLAQVLAAKKGTEEI
jgi:hypothetical protein